MAEKQKVKGGDGGGNSPSPCPFSGFRFQVGQVLRHKLGAGVRLVVLARTLTEGGTGNSRRYAVREAGGGDLGRVAELYEAELEADMAAIGMDPGDGGPFLAMVDGRVQEIVRMTAEEAAPMIERGRKYLAGIEARKAATEPAPHGEAAKGNGEANRNGAAKRKALRSARANPRPTAAAPAAA